MNDENPAYCSASYTYLRPGIPVARTVEVGDDFHVDLDDQGRVVGVEDLNGGDWRDALITLVMDGRLTVMPKKPAPAG